MSAISIVGGKKVRYSERLQKWVYLNNRKFVPLFERADININKEK